MPRCFTLSSTHFDCISIPNKASEMGNIHTIGPNEALIISGGWCGSTRKKMCIGGWAWAWWAVNDVQILSLEIFSLKPKCESVETAQGVPLCVTGVAQCKIMTQKEFLKLAAEQFLGMSIKQIKNVLLETLEGHLRAILGTLSVEDIYRDRDKFANLVREVATPDVGRMGIEIVSFTIKDIYDEVEYLSSLGRARVAEVKRDAQTGVSQAERDSGIQESQCEKESMDVKFGSSTKVEDAKRSYQLEKSKFEKEVNTAKAEAAHAYELQSNRLQQTIRNEQKQIELVERRKQIEIQQCEIERREKELEADVKLPAEADSYRVLREAAGKRNARVELAEAEAKKIRLIGEAEAKRIAAVGKAEAEALKLRAKAMAAYDETALMAIVLDTLPQLAKAVSKPLAKTSEIVIVNNANDNITDGINQMLAQVPPSVKALTGIDLKQFVGSKLAST